MRNLKKILALVLALVMTMSVMSVASAAQAGTSYVDDASITQFDESIQVLTQLGIFKGDDFNKIRPNDTITRAEAAALVYRVISTDVNDAQTSIYADYNKFTDVKSDNWFAGYVNFCANGQYIVGYGDDTFRPNANITGYQLLAIILRALGYGQAEEFQGTGWEIRTATLAKKLGITANINESTLAQAQTRAAVAEMIFQGMTCTQTVDYTALLGYTSGGSDLTGKSTHGTLGYEKFGLRGFYAASEKDDETTGLVDGYDVKSELMTNAPAIADNKLTKVDEIADFAGVTVDEDGAVDSTESQIVTTSLYGEPISFWYATSIVSGKNPAGEITVRYNPVASYSVKNDESVLFAGFSATGTKTTVAVENYNVDGVNYDGDDLEVTDADNIVLYKSLADKKTDKGDRTVTLENHGGKGTSTELFIADGTKFVVVKKSYVDTVDDTYLTKYLQPLTLTNYTLDMAAYKQQSADIVEDLKHGDVVLFNMYGEEPVADLSTLHLADNKVVTLTNSYVANSDDNVALCEGSYIMVGSTKYEYDSNAMDDELYVNRDEDAGEDELPLDRTSLLAKDPTEDTQKVYFDDYGYVIYSVPVTEKGNTGYMVVTTTEYGGYDKDNGYYLNISGYTEDGKAVTFKGAFGEGIYVYTVKKDADDYEAPIGIYQYTTDLDTGFVSLVEAGDPSDAEAIYAGDPDAVAGDVVSDSETVFVVANYNTKGAITGYDVYTGIKNIKDLKDAQLDDKSNTVIYTEYIDWDVTYVDNQITPNFDDDTDDARTVDLVLVLGAKQSTDLKVSSSVSTVPEMFFLLDEVPVRQFAEYNTYSVIMDGKVTTINVDVDAEGGATTDDASIFEEGVGFYKVNAWAGDYVYGVDYVENSEIAYLGVDVLSIDAGNGSIWAYSSCHNGDGEDNQGYFVLADNYKMYDITGGKVVEIKAEDLIVDEKLESVVGAGENALGYTGVKGIVGDWDAYGFATVVYVIDADAVD